MVEKVGALGHFIDVMKGFGTDDVGELADSLATIGQRLSDGKARLKQNLAAASNALDKLDALNATFGNGGPLDGSSNSSTKSPQ